LEELLGCEINMFFYPFGSLGNDFNKKRDCHFLTVGKYAEDQILFLQKNGIKNIHMFLEL
jgi:hypothetical protein